MPLLLIPLLGFACTVTAVWLKHHFFVTGDDWLVIGFPLLASAPLFALFAFWIFFWKQSQPVYVRRILLLVSALFLALFIFNSQAFFVGWLPGQVPVIPFASWLPANLSFIEKLGGLSTSFILLTAVLAATGNLLLKRRIEKESESDGYWFFMRLAVGASVWAALLLLLGVLDLLVPAAIWAIVLCLIGTEWRFLRAGVRWIIRPIAWYPAKKDPLFAVMAIGFLLIATNLVGAIRPDPTGYDDMTYYMNRVQLMVENQALIPGGNPFPFELLATALGIASQDKTLLIALGLGVYGLLLGTAILYAFGRALFGHRTGLIAATVALSIPMGPALALAETKPDIWLAAIAVLFFWTLIRWIDQRDWRYGYLAFFLLGFSLTIKLTALFLIAPLGIAGLIFLTVSRQESIRHSLRSGILASLFLIMPILPWLLLAEGTRLAESPRVFSQSLTSFSAPGPSLSNDLTLLIQEAHCSPATGPDEDFARFATKRNALTQIVFLPWDITLNTTVRSFATEVGLLFLAILPLWIFFAYPPLRHPVKKLLGSPMVLVALFTTGYFLLWLLLAKLVPWYGYPVIALLALLTAAVIERSRPFPFVFRLLMILLIISLLGNSLVQMKFPGSKARLLYGGGVISADAFLETMYPGTEAISQILNANLEARIYATGSRLWYVIENNTIRGYQDGHLDAFNCLLTTYGPEETLEKFRELDIRYIFFSKILVQEMKNQNRPTLSQKVTNFTDFIGTRLRVVWGSADFMIFEVP